MESEVVEGKKRFSKKFLIIAGIILLIGAIIGLNIYRSGQKAGIQVKSSTVKESRMVETVLASGKVTADEKEVIYSEVSGSVKKIHVKLGQQVKTRQLLMELDIPDAESKLMQAQTALDEAESRLLKSQAGGRSLDLIEAQTAFARAQSDFEQAKEKLRRNETLFAQGAISKADFELIQADYTKSEADYKQAEARLKAAQAGAGSSLQALQSAVAAARSNLELARRQADQRQLKASMNGRVLSMSVQNGDMVSPNTALASIGNLDSLQVSADIAEADASKLKVGQKVSISSNALMDVNYRGEVREIGLEAQTRTKNQGETTAIPVIISIQKNSLLRPGYNVDLKITTAINQKAVVVPFDAIIEKRGHSCVYLVEDGKAKLQQVQTGISNNSSIQIKSGVTKGDKVIINPPQELKDGSEVVVK